MVQPITHERLIELGFEHRPDEGDDMYWHEGTRTVYELMPNDGLIRMHMPEPDVINLHEPRLLAFIYALTGEYKPVRIKVNTISTPYLYTPVVDTVFGPENKGEKYITQVLNDHFGKEAKEEDALWEQLANARHNVQKFGKEERELAESVLNQPLTHADIVKAAWMEWGEKNTYRIKDWYIFKMPNGYYRIYKMFSENSSALDPTPGSYIGPIHNPSDLHTIMRLLNIKA